MIFLCLLGKYKLLEKPMAKIKIEFDIDNAAFEDELFSFEIQGILTELSEIISNSGSGSNGNIKDSNGNTIGTWSWEENEDDDDGDSFENEEEDDADDADDADDDGNIKEGYYGEDDSEYEGEDEGEGDDMGEMSYDSNEENYCEPNCELCRDYYSSRINEGYEVGLEDTQEGIRTNMATQEETSNCDSHPDFEHCSPDCELCHDMI